MESKNFVEKFNALDAEAKEVVINLVDLLTAAIEERKLYEDLSKLDARIKKIGEKYNSE